MGHGLWVMQKNKSIAYSLVSQMLKKRFFVIPVKTGIQSFLVVACALDTRLRGYDDFLQNHKFFTMLKTEF